jgi:hypothetical protein
MVIEQTLGSSPGPTEMIGPAITQTGKEPAVSEWTSILNFLFQIEAPLKPETDSIVAEESQPQNGLIAAATDLSILWASFLPQSPAPHSPADPSGEADKLSETVGAKISTIISPVDEGSEVREQPSEDTPLFEMSGSEWTVLPEPILAPYQDRPAALPPTEEASPEPVVLQESGRYRPAQSPERGPLPAWSKQPTPVEAVFRLHGPNAAETGDAPAASNVIAEGSTAAKPQPAVDTPAANSEPQDTDSRDTDLLEPKPQENSGLRQRRVASDDSLPSGFEEKGRQGASSESGRDAKDDRAGAAPSHELATFPEQGPLYLLHSSYGARKLNREIEVLTHSKPLHDASRTDAMILNPEKRLSPLQLELRVSSEDFGTPSTKNGSEVRLQLLQRGDEVFMKIHGGDERFAIRADAEWERLIERLKPHGLEPITKAIPTDPGRREGELSTAPATAQTEQDSASSPQDEQRRFGNEQQQHQQRQQRQRSLDRFRKNASAFSMERDLNGPQ